MTPRDISRILDDIPVQVAWRRPDSIVRETPAWFQVITPSNKIVPLNGVYRSLLSPENADDEIEKAVEEFRGFQTPFRWIVTETSRPADLGSRLEKLGFEKDHEALGLAAKATEILAFPTGDVKVMELTEGCLDEWVDAALTGWGNPEAHRVGYRADVSRALRDQRDTLRYFSAFIGSRIVGTGTLRLCTHSAHLLGSSVRPDFRGRGIYRALVAERAKFALGSKFELVTTHGMANTSAPILKKMGFGQFSWSTQFSFA